MVIVSLMAHPLDAWSLCGGTLARLARECDASLQVAALCSQSDESPSVAAGEILGAKFHSLGQHPWRLFFDDARVETVAGFLRDIGADLVLTHHPADSIPDHQVTSQIVLAACLASACPSYATPSGGQPLSSIPALYFCDPVRGLDSLGRACLPGISVDISHFVEIKSQLLAGYQQSTEAYPTCADGCVELSEIRGAHIGAHNAEGFSQYRGFGHCSEDVLGTLLGCWPAEPI